MQFYVCVCDVDDDVDYTLDYDPKFYWINNLNWFYCKLIRKFLKLTQKIIC